MDIKRKREQAVDLVQNHMKEADAYTKYKCSNGVVHRVCQAAADLLAKPEMEEEYSKMRFKQTFATLEKDIMLVITRAREKKLW